MRTGCRTLQSPCPAVLFASRGPGRAVHLHARGGARSSPTREQSISRNGGPVHLFQGDFEAGHFAVA
jgi:hypothetical protein